MESRRLLFIIARPDAFGGSARHVRDMAKRLSEDGHEVKILIGGDPTMQVPQRIAEAGVEMKCLPELGREVRPLRDLKALFALRREIKAFAPDLVSTHASKGGTLGRLACVGLGIPTLYTPHCWSFVDGFKKAKVYRLIESLLARITTRIVAVAEDERQFALERSVGRPEQIVVIHNGLGEVPPPPQRQGRAGTGAVRIVMVGRFEEQKDHQLLVRSLGQLSDFDWHLKFIGDGPRREPTEALVRQLGLGDRVEFAGYSTAVEEQLAGADLFALITNWEGFPRSILEAMRAGLPVVASDVGGCRESVLDGETGRIVPKGDGEALAGVLRELLGDGELRERLGRRGFEVYRDRFSFERMYQAYLDLYRSVFSEACPSAATLPHAELDPGSRRSG